MRFKPNFLGNHKKWLISITLLLSLLVADYGLKVYELTSLKKSTILFVQIRNNWDISYERDYLQKLPSPEMSKERTAASFDRFVSNSEDASVQLFQLSTKIDRSRIAPWHNDVQYAYQDTSNYYDEWYEYLRFINWSVDGKYNPKPTMHFDDSKQLNELSAVAINSYFAAMPRIRVLEYLYNYE